MKILFIEPCFVNFGGYFRAYSICSSLSKKRIAVDMLCSQKEPFSFTVRKRIINENFTIYELPRLHPHFFLNGRLLRGILGILFGLFGNYNIIHAAVPVQLESNIPALVLKLMGKPVIMDWDDYWEGSTIYGEYSLLKKYVSFCERRAPAFFNNMVVVSDFLQKKARARGARNIVKLINGVDIDQFGAKLQGESRKRLNLKQNGKYLLTFGHTYINDRAYLLFKTIEYIIKEDPQVVLLFNQDPQKIIQEQNLKKRIDKSVLKNIVTTGYIPDADLPYYLGAVDATIFLMGDADNERACFPIRIGSYLNGETIIILNDVNSEASNTLKRFDCAIIDADIKKLAKKTVLLLKDKEAQDRLRQNVKKAKRELDWDNQIETLITYYQKLLKNGR